MFDYWFSLLRLGMNECDELSGYNKHGLNKIRMCNKPITKLERFKQV